MKIKLFTLLLLASALFANASYGMEAQEKLTQLDKKLKLQAPATQENTLSLFEFLKKSGYTIDLPTNIGTNFYNFGFMHLLKETRVIETENKHINFNFYDTVHTLFKEQRAFTTLFDKTTQERQKPSPQININSQLGAPIQRTLPLQKNKSFWFKPAVGYISAFGLGVAALKAFQYFKASDYLPAFPFISKK